MLVEMTHRDDAEYDFAHDGAYFARDLRRTFTSAVSTAGPVAIP